MAWDWEGAKEVAAVAGAGLAGFLIRMFRRRRRVVFTAEQLLELNKMKTDIETALASVDRLERARELAEQQAREDLQAIRNTVDAALARLWSFRRGGAGQENGQ